MLTKIKQWPTSVSGHDFIGSLYPLGTRTLVISLLSHINKFMPLGERVWSIYPEVECSPCPGRDMKACSGQRWCAEGITPQILCEAATLLLANKEV
ncbi:hypothetical protein [Acetomicrobium sp.]|uniref:hypothetical protein n=1 Tax=Acetomicrobium sp. TaxID=1872099 RepID=UPI002B261414|nr:hypothetical protein [Acetomicrobium sp.]